MMRLGGEISFVFTLVSGSHVAVVVVVKALL